MEMHQIRYFLAVCRTQSFTQAAALCNVTQPALTRSVQRLEEEFGGLLFNRVKPHVELTELGRLIRPHFEQIVERASDVRNTARRLLKLEDTPLKLGIMCTIGPLRFIGFLREFGKNYAGIEVTLYDGVPERLTDLLIDGAIDIAIFAQPEGFDPRLRAQSLYQERFAVGFAMEHRFQRQTVVRPADMANENYLARINCEYQDRLDAVCVAAGVDLNEVYRSEREDWIQTMVVAGMGVCFIPEFSTIVPGLQTRPLVDPEVMREVSLVSLQDRPLTAGATALSNAARAYKWS